MVVGEQSLTVPTLNSLQFSVYFRYTINFLIGLSRTLFSTFCVFEGIFNEEKFPYKSLMQRPSRRIYDFFVGKRKDVALIFR